MKRYPSAARRARNPWYKALKKILRPEGGANETVIEAWSDPQLRRSWGPFHDSTPEEYSLILMMKEVDGKATTSVVTGAWFPIPIKVGTPESYTLLDIIDVDGDGQNEIMIGSGYYEGNGIQVMKLLNGKFINVVSGGEGA